MTGRSGTSELQGVSATGSGDNVGVGASSSVLEKQVSLAELVEIESFRDVMRSFADLYRVGVKVFDASGNKMVDIRVASGTFCGYLFEHGGTRQMCTSLVMALKNDPFPEKDGVEIPRVVNCFSGLRYVVMPLHYEGDLMGRLIFGPYLPDEASGPDERLYQIAPTLEKEKLEEYIRPIRQSGDELVSKALVQLQRVIEVILFTSFRAMLTSQMHIESVTASYQELQGKNRKLSDNNERLKELDKMKSNFLATVSHELRTPLTSVIGYSEMLLEGMAGGLNDEQTEYIGTIMEKGESLLAMISQILDLSRVESGNLRVRKSDFVVGDVLKHSTTSVLPQAAKKSIELVVEIAEDLPGYHGDKDKIGQVAVNLLGNAVKFTPEKGTITMRAMRWTGVRHTPIETDSADHGAGALFDLGEEQFIRFEVQDTGIGIPQDRVEKVFDRFFQVDNTSTREYGGTGLGLSICKSFIEGHGGDIWAESVEGKGTTFFVLLPIPD